MAHKQAKDVGSQSGAKDVKKTPGKGAKLPPMPAAKRGPKTAKGVERKVKKGY
jgi:hypothetical protein